MKTTDFDPATSTMRVEKEVDEIRWLASRVFGPNPFDVRIDKRLQHRFNVKIYKHGCLVSNTFEWRDVPTVMEE